MCHDDDSRPPELSPAGEIGEHGGVALSSPDGTAFAAYRARPGAPTGTGMVVLPDVRGLHPFYVELAKRFAAVGFDTVAIDYFGRTAGVGERGEDFDTKEHMQHVTPEHVRADAGSAVDFLRAHGAEAIFTVGFCFGGGTSWLLAASDLPLAGAIGFYGRPGGVREVADEVRAPILMLVAGDDAATPRAESEQLDTALTAAGKEHEMYVYEGAPHSFFDRRYSEWRDACADSWERVLAFTRRHAGTKNAPNG